MDDRGKEGICPGVVWSGGEYDWIPPRGERLYLRGVGWKFLAEWPFNEAHRKLLVNYRPSRKYRAGLFIPCSYGKPYSQSYIHYFIRKTIANYIRKGILHEVILTNAGVVPRELDEHWPYTAYDWNPTKETTEIKKCYKNILKQRIRDYLGKFGEYYESYIAYLRWDSDSWMALKEASKELGYTVPNLAAENVPLIELDELDLGLGYKLDPDLILITPTSLKNLVNGLESIIGEVVK
ncbi:MAG: DUF5591 domain-containing protein [Desulfurococcales archaeon]|nr:DUF5591 domain-containing protein [Desulfurococcales archaeon]